MSHQRTIFLFQVCNGTKTGLDAGLSVAAFLHQGAGVQFSNMLVEVMASDTAYLDLLISEGFLCLQ